MSPLAIAAVNLISGLFRMSSISNNVANATTPGYKQQVTSAQPFADMMASGAVTSARAYPGSAPIAVGATDFAAGPMRFSGNPLDVAVEGRGFFELSAENGPVYTRAGSFKLDARGRLVSDDGLPVMGVSGEILLTTAQPVIDGNGAVFENGKQVGQIKIVRFENPRTLKAIGGARFAAGPESAIQIESFPRMRQGYLEGSNVNTAHEMVRLIETVRHFEANQKLVQGYDDSKDRAIRRFGEF